MAQCQMCSRQSWLLQVSSHGLCKSCEAIYSHDVKQHMATIKSALAALTRGGPLMGQLSRCELAGAAAAALARYEQFGLSIGGVSPGALLGELAQRKQEIIQRELNQQVQQARLKASTVQSPSKQRAQMHKVLAYAEMLKSTIPDTEFVDKFIRELRAELDQQRLKHEVAGADNLLRAGNTKRALAAYYEALHLLMGDSVDDRLQGAMVAHIKAQIAQLGGDLDHDMRGPNMAPKAELINE